MKYIKMYADQAAYDADKGKKYPNVGYVEGSDTVIYMNEPDWSKEYLTFEAIEAGTFTYTSACTYSMDGGVTWTELAANTPTPTVNAGGTIMFKKTGVQSSGKFSSSNNFNAMGNPYSVLSGDNFTNLSHMYQNALYGLFSNCTGLISAGNISLPLKTLTGLANYGAMFSGCTSLTTAPELPATTLKTSCYIYMFAGCTSLTTAPELPATTLATNCYLGMFENCSSLRYIKMLATDISANNSRFNWVSGVAATGTFVKHPSMTSLPSGASGIPTGWTVVDAS